VRVGSAEAEGLAMDYGFWPKPIGSAYTVQL